MFNKEIKQGLTFLSQQQTENGEYATYWSYEKDMRAPKEVSSPFITALLLDFLKDLPDAEALSLRGLQYLADIRPASGFFAFFAEGIDADLDDTCLLNDLLQEAGYNFAYQNLAQDIAKRALPDGRYYTWIRPSETDPNDLDDCVCVNVLRFLFKNKMPFDAAWLINSLRTWYTERDTLYYVQPFFLLYFVAQLPPKLKSSIYQYTLGLATKIAAGPHTDVMDLAFRIIAAVEHRVDNRLIKALTAELLRQQNANGSWPARAAFQAFNYWGSKSLTTAACLSALNRVKQASIFSKIH